MDIYHYHPTSGEYLGPDTAAPDPLEAEKFLIPRNATALAPPAAGAGEAAVFDGTTWSVQIDRRAITYYMPDGSLARVAGIGEEPPVGATETPPAPTAAALKAHLASLRFARETGGATVGGVTVNTDRESVAFMGLSLQTVTSWPLNLKGKDGTFTSVDLATMQALVAGVTAHVQGSFDDEKTVSEAIDAATVTDIAGVDAAWAATAV